MGSEMCIRDRFLDAAKIAGPSAKDQLHMEENGHRALAEAIAALIQRELR